MALSLINCLRIEKATAGENSNIPAISYPSTINELVSLQNEKDKTMKTSSADEKTIKSWTSKKTAHIHYGSIANVRWKAISMSDLREHPCFIPLPPPNEVIYSSAKDFCLFRQESWQWDALHQGRLTTSKLSSCLGFYEPLAAKILGIPNSLQGHERAVSSWEHLRRKSPENFDFLNETLTDYDIKEKKEKNEFEGSVWTLNKDINTNEMSFKGDEMSIDHDESRKRKKTKSDLTTNEKSKENKEIEKNTKHITKKDFFLYNHYSQNKFKEESTNPTDNKKKDKIAREYGSRNAGMSRLAWGSKQEATAILAALNYFCTSSTSEEGSCTSEEGSPILVESGARVLESGMWTLEGLISRVEGLCVKAEETIKMSLYEDALFSSKFSTDNDNLLRNALNNENKKVLKECKIYKDLIKMIFTDKSMPLIGASPDGLILQADGKLEILEVKCTSPFYSNRNGLKSSGGVKKGLLAANERKDVPDGLGVWHIPQLQWEMLCVGPACKSAIVVLLGVNNAAIYRVDRDDEYIMWMAGFMEKFYKGFISEIPSNKMKPPPVNFFNPKNTNGYEKLLKKTVFLAENAKLVKKLNSREIQRNELNSEFFL